MMTYIFLSFIYSSLARNLYLPTKRMISGRIFWQRENWQTIMIQLPDEPMRSLDRKWRPSSSWSVPSDNFIYLFIPLRLLFVFWYYINRKKRFWGKKLFNAKKIDIFGGFRTDLPEVGKEDTKFFPDLQNMFHDG